MLAPLDGRSAPIGRRDVGLAAGSGARSARPLNASLVDLSLLTAQRGGRRWRAASGVEQHVLSTSPSLSDARADRRCCCSSLCGRRVIVTDTL